MCKRFSVIALAALAAAAAYAQQNPSQLPASEGTNTFGSSNPNNPNSSINCSDPLMAASSLCSGQLGSNALRGGFGPSASGSSVPFQPQNQLLTYTDDSGRPTTRERSTTIPLAPEPLTEFQKFAASTTGIVLPVFGADLFQSVPSTFAPVENAPVPPDYIIGPDDLVRIRIWGQVNINANLRVDRSGDIYIPQVGALHVAGVHFSDLDQMVRTAVSKIYRNFDLQVQLGDIRSIQIYVTGEARRPGVYTVSSLSTLVDGLFSTGGPSLQGSMRHIELRRGGAVVTTLDLYRFLISGDKTNDTKLLPGDIIHIPQVGPEAAILGSVRRPAIYELLPGETIGDALKDAGNLTSLASDARASLERTVDRSGLQAMEVRLDTAGMSTPLHDGDILRVISIVSRFQKTVTLRGNTANPGRFAWHEGMRLSELIPDKDSLITREYWWKRASLGLPAPEFQPLPALSALRQPGNPIDLPLQQSMARRQPNGTQQPGTQLQNGVMQNPAPQAGAASDASFFWDNVDGAGATAANAQGTGNQAQGSDPSAQLNPQRQLGPRASESALAEPEEENQPAAEINPPAPRRTVVKLSVPEIDWSYAVIERMNQENLRTELIPFDLGKLVLQHDSSQDLELKPGDIVTVFSQADIHVPLSEQTTLVRLEGEFVHSGTYSARPGETLRALVERAGGLTPGAYLYGSVFTRESTRVLQQRRMDENVHAMILQMQRGNLALAASPVSTPGDLAGVSAAQASGRELVAQLQQLRATGRIVFAFQPDSQGAGALPDIPLQNGDTFLVPSVPATVNAVGAIFNQNSFLYRPDARLGSYLQLAGGPNPNADKKRMFLVRANGSVVSRDSVNSAWGNEFMHLKLNPGDTIFVPDKTIKPSALRGVLDWTQLFAQMGIGIAAIRVLFP
jgi:protein involved in polysaccharide export with SLBB domain